jgi:DNA-directed RNA polymerase subunit RPC12/RpoP
LTGLTVLSITRRIEFRIEDVISERKITMSDYSMGAPLQYKCARCGKMLHGGSGMTLFGGMDVLEHILKRAKRCPSCGKIFCGQCSVEVENQLGKPKGAVDFTCPFCRTTGISG